MILHSKGSIVEDVMELTGGNGVQAVFDTIGKDTLVFGFRFYVHDDSFRSQCLLLVLIGLIDGKIASPR